MTQALRGRVPNDERSRDFVRGSFWAVLALGTMSGGGLIFWVVAAATTDLVSDVGRAAAWYTLVQLVVSVTSLGAPILINRRGGEANGPQLAGAAALVVMTAAVIVGFASPVLAGGSWSSLSGAQGLSLGPYVALACAGAGLTLVVDARLISLRRWRSLFARTLVATTARIGLLAFDPFGDRATWLFAAAVGPVALSGFLTWALLARDRSLVLASVRSFSASDRWFFATQHLGVVASQAPYHAIPLLVARHVEGSANAAFYLVWSIGVMAMMLPQTLAQVLLSESSLDLVNRTTRIRQTLTANVVLILGAWCGAMMLGGVALRVLGREYAGIAPVLPWLLLAAAAWGLTSVCLTEARLSNDAVTTMLITGTVSVGSIAATFVAVRSAPIWGATYSWLGANAAAMVLGVLALEYRSRSIGRSTT